ncbi:MAG: thiamine pyrophosphate-binding protein, partial [Deltaproteobacteria bacterium]|nr:thiamine pyrophosphate-binding protein [Deltaproteobacteria bacterium]
LQRCYLQARLQPSGPVFLSVPMNFMLERTSHCTFKKTRVIDDSVPSTISEVVKILKAVPSKKLAIVADYAVRATESLTGLSRIATALDADIFAAPFHVQGTVDPLHPNYRGQLPSTTREIHATLSGYHTMLLIGEKVDSFTYNGCSALPSELQVIQISPASSQLGFDYPCDVAVFGDVRASLESIATSLGPIPPTVVRQDREAAIAAMNSKYSVNGANPSNALILAVLRNLDTATHVITEGSSEDAIVQEMAVTLGFRNVHFSPRGGGLGWAMPLGVGIGLATGKHCVCFVGDGGSLFSIHAIWTAAKYHIPVVFVCFVNHEYRLLKDLWCHSMGTAMEKTHFVGMDFNDPNVDVQKIAAAFGARTGKISESVNVSAAIKEAFGYAGPSFLIIDREP